MRLEGQFRKLSLDEFLERTACRARGSSAQRAGLRPAGQKELNLLRNEELLKILSLRCVSFQRSRVIL